MEWKLDLSDSASQRLQSCARQLGIAPEEMICALVTDLFSRQEEEVMRRTGFAVGKWRERCRLSAPETGATGA